MPAPECLRCNVALEPGFVIDEGYGSRKVTAWVEGEPEPSLWSGIKTGGRRRIDIETWRCPSCGVLESYAPS